MAPDRDARDTKKDPGRMVWLGSFYFMVGVHGFEPWTPEV